jgi:HJR/Mrr/RecB family endonuclease
MVDYLAEGVMQSPPEDPKPPRILKGFLSYQHSPVWFSGYESVYEEFLEAEGRGSRRLIGFPSVLYTEGFESLLAIVNEILLTGHQPTMDAAMSSLEVDLSWARFSERFSESIRAVDLSPGQERRIARRLTAAIELLATRRLGADSSSQIYHRPEIESVAPAIRVASSELARYIAKHPQALYNLHPRQFEELIADVLSNYGWRVELTPYSKDGGYDLLCVSKQVSGLGPKLSLVVECKKYRRGNRVGLDVARQLIFVKNDLKAGNAMLVTSSDFTRGVYDFQSNRLDLDLKNFDSVIEWCTNYASDS